MEPVTIKTEMYMNGEPVTLDFFRDNRELFVGYPTAEEIEEAINKAKNMGKSDRYTIHIDEDGIKIKAFIK